MGLGWDWDGIGMGLGWDWKKIAPTKHTKIVKNGPWGGWGWGGARGVGWGQVKNTDRDKEPRPLPPALPAHKQQVKGPNLDQKFDV